MSKWVFLLAGLSIAVSTAAAEVLVIVNPAAVAPTKEQVSDVYLGKSRDFTPLDHVESSAIRTEFYRKATGREGAQIRMVWARLVFTGRGLPPRELRNADAVKQAVASDRMAIGYIDRADLDASVKVALSLD